MKNFYSILLISIIILSFQANAVNLNVSGNISSNTTWSADTIKITGDINIQTGITLTVNPGVYVQVQNQYKINVQGRLIAQGTASNKITFTALSTSIGWKGIRFENTPIINDTSIIQYCVISYGRAVSGTSNDKMGGAILVYNYSKVKIMNSILSNNYASYYGGAIACWANANPKIYNNLIINNSASSVGGAVIIYYQSNPRLINNTIANNTASYGGGLYIGSGFIGEISNCIIYSNAASNSSQISGTASNVYNCDIEGGYSYGLNNIDTIPQFVSPTAGAGSSYNGISANYALTSNSYLIDRGSNSLANNTIPNYDVNGKFRFDNNIIDIGAAEYIASTEVCGTINSNTTWSGRVLLNCDVTVSNGVTLTIQPGAQITATGHYKLDILGRLLAQGTQDNFINITAWNHDEGWSGIQFVNVAAANDTSKIEYCKITYKKDISTYPNYYGAIYMYSSSKILVRNNIITNNYSNYGAGITVYNSSAIVVGNLIANNQTYYSGGGLYVNGSASYSPLILNNTITKNKSTTYSYAGGVYSSGGNVAVFKNNIIYYNEDNAGNHGNIDNLYPGTGINITYSCIEGAYSGTGNISSDPLFKNVSPVAGIAVNINNFNFALQPTSPCIDAGSAAVSGLSLPALDLAGKTRNYSSAIDMGAYEDKSALAVCGTISSSQIWDANTINVNCDVTIANGATVTVAPGTRILFNGHYKILVLGALQAQGAQGDTIVFTAANTSVGWDGIQIVGPSAANDSCLFNYCRFEYAKRNPSNYQLSGGAISIKSQTKSRITFCRFVHNEAIGSYGYGGALSLMYLHGSSTDGRHFNNNVFENNNAQYSIIYINYSNIEFINNTLFSNTTNYFGSLYTSYAGGKFYNNLISNNSSTYGGGVYLQGQYSDYYIYFHNNIVVNNQATYGGGIYVNETKPDLFNNTISNNYSTSSLTGGGIYFTGNADANFKSNIIYGNKSLGAVSNQICIDDVSADPKFYNNDIEGGTAAFSGTGSGINYSGVYSQNLAVTPEFTSASSGVGNTYNGKIANWSISQGSQVINGGFSNSSNLNLPLVDFAGNSRIFNGRIDVGAYENQDAIISPCTISSNTVWEADTIKVTCNVTINSGKTLTILPGTNVLFMGHYGINVEGSILALGTSSNRVNFLMNDTTGFWDSTSTAGGWDGINFNSVVQTNDSSKFSYCTFSYAKAAGSNYIDKSGSAMYIYNSPKISITNCIFSNNFAYYYGGALFVESSNFEFSNNIVANNTAGYYGGGLYLDDVNINFLNNSIVNNKGRYYAGMYINGSELIIKNSLFWGNYAWQNVYGYYSQLGYQSSNLSKIYNSNVQYGKNLIGNGYQLLLYQDNLEVNPEFINPSSAPGHRTDGLSANWNISNSSPMLNGGLFGTYHQNLDFAGNTRLVADTLDIGAFEVQLSPHFIDLQPTDKDICVGAPTTFSAHSTVSASYKWQKNGIDIIGSHSSNLIFASVALSDTGNYNCIISNTFGSISSDTVRLTVKTSPIITSPPVSTSNCLGSSVTFTSSASGTSPLTYQWYNTNGQLQSGTSSQSYEIGNGVLTQTGNGYPTPFANYYWGAKHQFLILASELTAAGVAAGDISSLGWDVNALNSCPTLGSFEIKIGSTVTSSLTNTWISGLTSVYSVGSYQPTSGWNNFGFQSTFTWDGTSNIVVEVCSNNSSWITNGNASVNQTATAFNSTHYIRQDASGVCLLTGSGTLVMQRPNIKLVAGSNSSTSSYSINSITANDASNYYMIATNSCGIAQSTGATLSLKYAPSLTPISATDDICENNSYAYSTTTSQGSAPITYQWFKDGSSINAATSLTYNITSGSSSDAGIYYCKATNICGSDSTNQSVLVVNTLPQISSQSSSQTACSNQSVTMGITASGTAPLTYQWYKGGTPISGATNNTYTLSSLTVSDAANYYCKVSNTCTVTPVSSAAIELTVNTAPSISSQTGNVNVCSASAAAFSVTASGTAPLTYQWYNSSGAIAGATNNLYTIGSAITASAGNYYCIVTNSCGSVTSNQIPLTVNSAPSVSSQPSSLTRCETQSAIFTIVTTGTSPITYQWYKGGIGITSATSNSYLISPVSSSDASSYYCVATNSCGSATSTSVTLTVNTGVAITSQPSSTTVCAGSTPSFQITASGTATITYQWYKGNTSISGATNSTYSINSVDTSKAGTYYCSVSNSCSSINSNSIVLTVNQSPSINTQPSSATVCSGSSALMSVSASGTAPLTYQWYKGSSAISGATASSYLIGSTASSDASTYYCNITNSCGNVTSTSVTLTVNTNVSISSQSSSTTVCQGASPTFSITASGTSPMTYQWYKNNTGISGATNNSLSLTSVDTSNAASYYVIATNSCNSTQSNTMNLTVNQSPSINTQPSSATVCSGSSALMSVSASGTAPLTYQWYKGSSVISGATASSYLIGSAASSDASTYYCKITNSCGTVNSNSAIITVNTPVSISTQSGNATKCAGTSLTFSVTATGTASISYQWYYNGSAISGGTAATYSISSVSVANAGDYYCIATNSCNSVQSTTKTLTVNTLPSITQQSSSTTICNGSNLTLSIIASGTSPLTYQWYKSTTAITGEINSSLPMYQVNTSNAGSYYCAITNTCGNINSANINITVNQSPIITAQSSSTSVCKNSNASMSVTATGTGPLTYQWYKTGSAISGATNNFYTINSVDTSDAKTYYCVVTNSCGTATSTNIQLTVNVSPSITAQSSGGIKCAGSSFSLSVSATGTSPVYYQWYDANGVILGATNSLYLINSIDSSDAGVYYCTVTNSCGSVTSSNKTLVVNYIPSINTQSSSATKCEGTPMIFTLLASGSSPLTYQWFADTGAIAGANANSYSLSSVVAANAGNYYCKVANTCGYALSSTKTLTVNTAPNIISQTNSDTLCQNQTLVLNINAQGTSPISYQWYKNFNSILGASNDIYMIASVDTFNAGYYYAIATNICGNDQSNNIALTVNKLAAITYQSGDSSRCQGGSMTFSLNASGTSPLTYQWYKSGSVISGATAHNYSLSSVSSADAGYYSCVVSNSCNTVNTSNKILTVHNIPQVTLGADTSFCYGGQINLSPGFGYNCLWNTGSFNNQIAVSQSGSYWTNVTDQYGCSGISDTVNVNVVLPYSSQELCMAGVDSATQKNVVVYDKVANVGAVSYNIYKESSTTGVWNLIENKSYDSLSVVIDMTSNPIAHSDRYSMTVIDSCGNESAKSSPHKTMHLAVSPAVPSGYNLSWNAYQGFQVASYIIWKADTSGVYNKIDSVNGNIFMWHDTTSLVAPFWYQIEVIRPGGSCNPTKANTNYNTSRSNQASNGLAAPSNLTSNFIATPTQGKAPLVVVFYDQTFGSPTSWYWNFGDGNTSTLQNPAHQYDSIGIYDVTLTVTNSNGANSLTKFAFIDVVPDGIYVLDNSFNLQIFPNPYTSKTNIAYSLLNNSKVKIEVYSSLGQLVTTLCEENQQAGSHRYEFSASNYGFAEGIYLLRMSINDKMISRKLIEVK